MSGRKSIEDIIKSQLKWRKAELIMLWILIFLGIILVVAGIGVYFYVGKLTIAQKLSATSARNLIVAQIRMLYNFSRALGAVFSLIGLAVIILAFDRLSFIRNIHKASLATEKKGIKEI